VELSKVCFEHRVLPICTYEALASKPAYAETVTVTDAPAIPDPRFVEMLGVLAGAMLSKVLVDMDELVALTLTVMEVMLFPEEVDQLVEVPSKDMMEGVSTVRLVLEH